MTALNIICDTGVYRWKKCNLEQLESEDSHCECCSGTTRRVYGYLLHKRNYVAAYFVTWTLDSPDHYPWFDLIIGRWGETASAKDRVAVSVDYHNMYDTWGFGVCDEVRANIADPELVGATLGRDQVIGTDAAPHIFAMLDAVFVKETRLDEIRQW